MDQIYKSSELEPTKPTFNFATQREREEEVERLAFQLGQIIRDGDNDSRAELAEAASAIMREEAISADRGPVAPAQERRSRSRALNPLAAGIGLVLLGAGMALLVPLVGIAIAVVGAVAVLWGLAISWSR